VRAPLTPKTIPFWDAFVRRYNRAPVYTAPGAYDATYIYAEAVGRTKSISADALIPQLEKTDYIGTVGRIAFDDTHDVRAGPGYVNVRFSQWQDNGARHRLAEGHAHRQVDHAAVDEAVTGCRRP
jgi:branched-chain amino acid transport system substrate-binding protein